MDEYLRSGAITRDEYINIIRYSPHESPPPAMEPSSGISQLSRVHRNHVLQLFALPRALWPTAPEDQFVSRHGRSSMYPHPMWTQQGSLRAPDANHPSLNNMRNFVYPEFPTRDDWWDEPHKVCLLRRAVAIVFSSLRCYAVEIVREHI